MSCCKSSCLRCPDYDRCHPTREQRARDRREAQENWNRYKRNRERWEASYYDPYERAYDEARLRSGTEDL